MNLQLSPEMVRFLQSRTKHQFSQVVKPRTVRRSEKAKTLNRDRYRAVRHKLIEIMKLAEPTPFAAEGSCRAGVRASLCTQGWRWIDADQMAAVLVSAALAIVGAKRPTWYEGQPEWTQPGATPIIYDRCRCCHGPIPEGRRVFCCFECKNMFHERRAAQAHSEQRRIRQAAWRAAKKRDWL